MRLLCYELKKIIINKITIFTSLILLLIIIISSLSEWYDFKKQVGSLEEYNKTIVSYEGKINEDLGEKLKKEIEEKSIKSSEDAEALKLNEDEKRKLLIESGYITIYNEYTQWIKMTDEDEEYPQSIKGLESLLNKLKVDKKENTFVYKDTLKKLNMKRTVGAPEFHNTAGWNKAYLILLQIPGMVLISIMLILNIATMFSKEEKNGMKQVILATKNGHRKIALAKIGASLIFTVIWVTIVYLVTLTFNILPYKNLSAANCSLNSLFAYVQTPYKLTLGQDIIFTYLTTILSACIISIVFCAFSVSVKNSLSSIGIAITFLITPLFLVNSGFIAHILALFPSVTIAGSIFLKSYSSYNIMGMPVTYPVVAIFILILLMIISTFYTLKKYNHN